MCPLFMLQMSAGECCTENKAVGGEAEGEAVGGEAEGEEVVHEDNQWGECTHILLN